MLFVCLLSMCLGAIVARLAYLQVFRHGELSALAERQYSRTVVLHGMRGPIVDRHGATLAMSVFGESLFAHPRSLGDPVRVSERLGAVLNMRPAEVHATLTADRPFVWVQRRLGPATAAQIRALREPGLNLVPEPLRLYPNRELAAHVVGFEGVDGGLEGIERAFDAELQPAMGRAIVGRDALGRDVTTQQVLKAPRSGQTVALTIDRTIQYLAERELDRAWRRSEAKAALLVAIEPVGGDILAIALRPTFNPNQFLEVPSQDLRNRAIMDPFEPGPAFGIFILAAALEEGIARSGGSTPSGTRSPDIHGGQKEPLALTNALRGSLGDAARAAAVSLGSEHVYRYLSGFGFGSVTNVPLAGESRGRLLEPAQWSRQSLGAVAIGEGISVTALQLATAIAVIANGGTLVEPQLVLSLSGARNEDVRRFRPRAVRQVLSLGTSERLTRALTDSLSSGPDKAALIPGYDAAGISSIAPRLTPKEGEGAATTGTLSFVGFAPARNPKFVMFIMLEEPRGAAVTRDAAAAVFSAVGVEILRYVYERELPSSSGRVITRPLFQADGGRQSFHFDDPRPQARETVMGDVRGKSLFQALSAVESLGASVEAVGHGRVVRQTPPPGMPIKIGATIKLELR